MSSAGPTKAEQRPAAAKVVATAVPDKEPATADDAKQLEQQEDVKPGMETLVAIAFCGVAAAIAVQNPDPIGAMLNFGLVLDNLRYARLMQDGPVHKTLSNIAFGAHLCALPYFLTYAAPGPVPIIAAVLLSAAGLRSYLQDRKALKWDATKGTHTSTRKDPLHAISPMLSVAAAAFRATKLKRWGWLLNLGIVTLAQGAAVSLKHPIRFYLSNGTELIFSTVMVNLAKAIGKGR